MQKTLIKVDNLDGFLCHSGGKLYVDATMILSPGAKDELSKRGVKIVYGPCPDEAGCPHAGHGKSAANPFAQSLAQACGGHGGLEDLLVGVAAMLKKECGVRDPEQLKALSLQAVKTIRENL